MNGTVSYKVTGVLRNGRRFKAIHTRSYQHAMGINLWRGNVWLISPEGKATRIKEVWN